MKLSDLYTSLSSFINLSVACIDPHTVPCNKSIKETLQLHFTSSCSKDTIAYKWIKKKKSSWRTSYRWSFTKWAEVFETTFCQTWWMTQKFTMNKRFLLSWNQCQCLKQQLHIKFWRTWLLTLTEYAVSCKLYFQNNSNHRIHGWPNTNGCFVLTWKDCSLTHWRLTEDFCHFILPLTVCT